MSTLAIIAIVVGALVLLAILVSVSRRAARRRELGQAQAEAQHDDVRHHRGRAEESRTQAAIAEERAKRAEVEAELNEERATRREHELGKEN
jgi:FtsZ-interacting cell division protein ZipA